MGKYELRILRHKAESSEGPFVCARDLLDLMNERFVSKNDIDNAIHLSSSLFDALCDDRALRKLSKILHSSSDLLFYDILSLTIVIDCITDFVEDRGIEVSVDSIREDGAE